MSQERSERTRRSNVVHTPETKFQLMNAVHGALDVYDLPDLLALFPEGKVRVDEPLDAAGEPASSQE